MTNNTRYLQYYISTKLTRKEQLGYHISFVCYAKVQNVKRNQLLCSLKEK